MPPTHQSIMDTTRSCLHLNTGKSWIYEYSFYQQGSSQLLNEYPMLYDPKAPHSSNLQDMHHPVIQTGLYLVLKFVLGRRMMYHNEEHGINALQCYGSGKNKSTHEGLITL